MFYTTEPSDSKSHKSCPTKKTQKNKYKKTLKTIKTQTKTQNNGSFSPKRPKRPSPKAQPPAAQGQMGDVPVGAEITFEVRRRCRVGRRLDPKDVPKRTGAGAGGFCFLCVLDCFLFPNLFVCLFLLFFWLLDSFQKAHFFEKQPPFLEGKD